MGEIRGVLEGFLASPSKTQGGLWGDDEASPAANAPDVSNSAPIQPPAPKAMCLFTNPPEAENAPEFVTVDATDRKPGIPADYRGPGAWDTSWEIRIPERSRVTDMTASVAEHEARRLADHARTIPPVSFEAFIAQVKADVQAVDKPASEWVTLASRRMCHAYKWASLGKFVADKMDRHRSEWADVMAWLNSLTPAQVGEVFA